MPELKRNEDGIKGGRESEREGGRSTTTPIAVAVVATVAAVNYVFRVCYRERSPPLSISLFSLCLASTSPPIPIF